MSLMSSGKTPDRVVELITGEVKRTSQAATARNIGLTLLSVQRYLKGMGNPTAESLQKIADYFGETFIIEIKPRNGTSR